MLHICFFLLKIILMRSDPLKCADAKPRGDFKAVIYGGRVASSASRTTVYVTRARKVTLTSFYVIPPTNENTTK